MNVKIYIIPYFHIQHNWLLCLRKTRANFWSKVGQRGLSDWEHAQPIYQLLNKRHLLLKSQAVVAVCASAPSGTLFILHYTCSLNALSQSPRNCSLGGCHSFPLTPSNKTKKPSDFPLFRGHLRSILTTLIKCRLGGIVSLMLADLWRRMSKVNSWFKWHSGNHLWEPVKAPETGGIHIYTGTNGTTFLFADIQNISIL